MKFGKWQGWLRLVFWLALAVTLVMALLSNPPALPMKATDKVQHMAAFAALGLAIEVLQMIPTLHRDALASDWRQARGDVSHSAAVRGAAFAASQAAGLAASFGGLGNRLGLGA